MAVCAGPSVLEAVLPVDKIFWHGRHATFGFSSPLGKLPRSALRLLITLGWREVDRSDAGAVPALCWTTRRAADFPSVGENLPLVRMLPQACSAFVDDKVFLAETLAASGVQGVCPPTYTDLTALRELLADDGAMDDASLWFVKHRHGVKGKAVTPMHSPALRAWLGRHADARDFAVQAAVAPPEPRAQSR